MQCKQTHLTLIVIQKVSRIIICFVTSVSDPYHFDLDPDPRIRIRDHGSGSGSGSEVTFDSVNRIFPIRHQFTM